MNSDLESVTIPASPRYASAELYGGQRASVGRAVVICVRDGDGRPQLRAGTIAEINQFHGTPRIVDMMAPTLGPIPHLTFRACATADEAEAMPPGTWTWPPRV